MASIFMKDDYEVNFKSGLRIIWLFLSSLRHSCLMEVVSLSFFVEPLPPAAFGKAGIEFLIFFFGR